MLSLQQWLAAMRLPFTSVAVVPFVVGVSLAYTHGELVSPLAATFGAIAVFLICIGCYLSGEIFDQREDLETLKHGRNPFSGGSLLVAQGVIPERQVRNTAVLSFVVAALLGLLILLIHQNLLLVALGSLGLLAAATYSTEPIRLVKRGFGELFIGFCYGWLPLVTGYATASGHLPPFWTSVFFSLPVALAIFNVILINEFPDYKADHDTGKRNLLVRVGREAGGVIYSLASILAGSSLLFVWWALSSRTPILLAAALPVTLLAFYLSVEVGILRGWREPKRLERICALTIILNLSSAIIIGVLVRWH